MDFFKIDGKTYNVAVTAIEENFTILYSENTGRTMAKGRMILDPLGTFYAHKITIQPKQGYEADYDALFDYISVPRVAGMMVEAVHNQDTIKYLAYVSSGLRNVKKITASSVRWEGMQLNIVPMEAQVIPE